VPDQQRLHVAAWRGLPEEIVPQYDELPVPIHDVLFNAESSQIVEITADATTLPRVFDHDSTPLTGVSLCIEERPIAAVLLVGEPVSKEANRLLLGLADMAAVAIDKAHLYQATQRRLDELTLLHTVSLAATSALDFDIIITRTVSAIQATLGFEMVGLLLLDDSGEYLDPHPSFVGVEQPELEHGIRVGAGISGRVAQTGNPLRVPDISLVEDYEGVVSDVQSELSVPLKVGETVIGVINASSSHLDAFSANDERLLATIAGHLAMIIENARLNQEAQRRLREMSVLLNFAQHLSTNLQMESLLDTIVTAIRDLLACRGVSIALLDPENEVLEIKAAAGLKKMWRKEARLRIGEGIMGQVAVTGQSIYVPDAHKMEGFIFFDHSVHSLLTVPLISQNQVIGTLSIDHRQPDAFSADDERLVTIAAAQVAVAIENARLFQDVQERATRLAQAYDELKEMDRMKDELVQNVSHELRTPLTFLRGYVDLLLGGEMGSLNERQRQSLEIVSEKTTTVTRLVNNIMLLQQLERSTLQLGLLDVVTVANEALAEVEGPAKLQGVSLHLDAPPDLPLVLSDPTRLTLVFQNLLDNAIKFSPDGGEVRIQLEGQTDCIQVGVIDQGIGIAKDKLERIFDRFYQIDGSLTRRFAGTGLGLSISKKIVEAHGGEIWVTSQLGKGSTFYFTVPKSRKS
jgi:signal transduction histidine kinase